MSWGRGAVCDYCWRRNFRGLNPVRVLRPETEQCCYCNLWTQSGIYHRVNTAEVPYPQAVKT